MILGSWPVWWGGYRQHIVVLAEIQKLTGVPHAVFRACFHRLVHVVQQHFFGDPQLLKGLLQALVQHVPSGGGGLNSGGQILLKVWRKKVPAFRGTPEIEFQKSRQLLLTETAHDDTLTTK